MADAARQGRLARIVEAACVCVAAVGLPGSATAAAPKGPLVVDARTGEHGPANRLRDGDRPALDVTMPFVRSDATPDVAARINAVLYVSTLRIPPPIRAGQAVALPDDWPADEGLGFDVLRNDDRLLSVSITTEDCGSHCIETTTILHFDVRTGQRVLLGDVLTVDGERQVQHDWGEAGVTAYADGLARLPPQPADANNDEDEDAPPAPPPPPIRDPIDLKEDPGGDEHRMFFESCKSGWEQMRDRPLGENTGENFELPVEGGLSLFQPPCLAGPWRARLTSDVLPQNISLSAAQLAPLLSPYGRALLLRRPAAASTGRLLGHVLVGKLGNDTVTLVFDEFGCGATWFRERERQPMTMSGKHCGPDVSLSSGDGISVELHRDGGRLVGTWQDKSGAQPATFAP